MVESSLMLRRIFKFLTAISLAIFIGACLFWIRGYWKAEHLQFTWVDQLWQITSAHGRFSIDNEPQILKENAERDAISIKYAPRIKSLQLALGGTVSDGFEDDHEDELRHLESLQQLALAAVDNTSERSHSISAPVVALFSLILPALAYRAWLARRTRIRTGLCLVCGYDLRATPERCPECWAVAGRR